MSNERAFVAEVKRVVDARLVAHLDCARARAAAASTSAATVFASYDALVRRGGKRLRPALTVASAMACGGVSSVDAIAPDDALIDAGCAWELLQAYFLVHDDWMDGDEVRRGGPSAHAELAKKFGDAHLGASCAVLAGDLGGALAHRVLLEAKAPADVVREATATFARIHEEVVLGQAMDLTLEADDAALVEHMHALKTASYTVRGPLEMGAIFARGSGDARAALAAFAEPIGLAFQLRDDLLGTFGEASETGKPIGSDVRSRKRTALLVETRTRASADDRRRFDALLGAKSAPSDDDVAWATRLMESSGARTAIEARLRSLVDRACGELRDAPLTREGIDLLVGLADLATRRSA